MTHTDTRHSPNQEIIAVANMIQTERADFVADLQRLAQWNREGYSKLCKDTWDGGPYGVESWAKKAGDDSLIAFAQEVATFSIKEGTVTGARISSVPSHARGGYEYVLEALVEAA